MRFSSRRTGLYEEPGGIHLALARREPAGDHAAKAKAAVARASAMPKDDPDLGDDPARLARIKRLGEGEAE